MGGGKDQLVGHGVLPQLPVDPGADGLGRGLGKFVAGHEAGAHGGEAVQALAEVPLLVAGLQVPGGDVVDDGVAKDIVIGIFFPDVLRVPAQDDGQLRLIVQAIHEVKMPRDGVAGAGAVGGPLGEVDGAPLFPGKGVGVELLGLGLVLLVVHAQADHVLPGGGDGGQDPDLGQGQGLPCLPGQDRLPVGGVVGEQVVHGGVGQDL